LSVTPVGSNQIQNAASQLLQQLMASNPTGLQEAASGTSALQGDQLTLSAAAQQLTQAPAAVTQAMGDLLSGQGQVGSDLAQLKSYFQQHPQSLATVLSSLQGGAGAYGVSSSLGSNSALLTALMNQQSNASNPAALLGLLGNQGQTSLFSFLGDSGSGSSSGSNSLFG
jgi:hypothetical protein